MTFGTDWGWGADEATSTRILDAYLDRGGNFVDTANLYVGGASETILGLALSDRRERVVLASKYTDAPEGDDPNAAGNHRRSMVRAVEGSLQRLDTDRLDILYVHSWDFTTRPDEVMRALDDLVRQGKVLYAGISDTPAWIVSRCNEMADRMGWSPFVVNQIEYSLAERTSERELIPMSRALDIGVVAWSPLASGLLTGKYTRAAKPNGKADGGRLDVAPFKSLDDERLLKIARQVDDVADELGRTSAEVALAWVRDRGIIPIVGATTPKQIESNMGYLNLVLPGEIRDRLDASSAIELGFPHDFVRSAKGFVYGGMFERIERHRNEGLETYAIKADADR
jgi:aryl-alcohol dehydrogenase-like predicted oxidoreductase